jgi:hypothetical protein
LSVLIVLAMLCSGAGFGISERMVGGSLDEAQA